MSNQRKRPRVRERNAQVVMRYPWSLRKERVVDMARAGMVRRDVVKTIMALIMDAVLWSVLVFRV